MVQRMCKKKHFSVLVMQCKERAMFLVCTYIVLNQIVRAQPPCLQVHPETSTQINANDAISFKYCFNRFIYLSGFDYLKYSFVFFSALFDNILLHFCEFFGPQLTGPPFIETFNTNSSSVSQSRTPFSWIVWQTYSTVCSVGCTVVLPCFQSLIPQCNP